MRGFYRRVMALLGLSLAIGAGPAAAAPFTGLYVFGDSLSDVGNVFVGSSFALPRPPYFAGRFSNGPIWVDDLSARLGLGPVLPSLAGGTDFAFGGATTGTSVPAPPALVPNIVQQVGLFTAATGGHAPSTGLYAIWIGANDVLNAVSDLATSVLTLPQAQADVVAAAQTAAGALQTLAAEGARTFLVPLVSDLGKIPNVTQFPASVPVATALAQTYNAALVAAIQAQTAGQGLTVDYVDTFGLVDAAVANPAAFGFTNVTDPCYVGPYTGGGTVCATPDSYLFWDGQHGTARTNAIFANAALTAVVPEPASGSILLIAVLGAVALRRRARA